MTGIIISLLIHKYNILVCPGPNDKRNLMIIPPLIINKKEIDYFITSIDDLFSKSIVSMVKTYGNLKVKDIIT